MIVVLDPTVASSSGPGGDENPTPDDCLVEDLPTATSTPEPVIEDGPPIVPLPGETPVEGPVTDPEGDQAAEADQQPPAEACSVESTTITLPTATPRPVVTATPTPEAEVETPDAEDVPTPERGAEGAPVDRGETATVTPDREPDSSEPTPAIVEVDPLLETPELVPESGVDPTAAPVATDPVAPTPEPGIENLDPTAVVVEIVATEAAPEDTPTAEVDAAGFDLDQAPLYAALPAGSGPVSGALRIAPSGGVLVDQGGDGTSLALADLSGGAIAVGPNLYYPVWSDSGTLEFAYYPPGAGQPSIGAWSPGSGVVTPLTEQDDDNGEHRDVPAGWIGGNLYYERTFPAEGSGRVELRRVSADGSGDALVWEAEGVQVTSAHPFPVFGGFAIATSEGWLLVRDGEASGLGGVALGGRISQLEVGPAGWTAYADGRSIAVVDSQNYGSVVLVLPFGEGPGAGFSWSPDGTRLAVTDGSRLTIFDAASGSELASWAAAGIVGSPLWTDEGVLFVDGGTDAAIRLLPAEVIEG